MLATSVRDVHAKALIAGCLALLVMSSVASCSPREADREPLPADPRAILQASLSHGIGESPLDSPLLADSQVAALLVRLRRCAPATEFAGLVDEADSTRNLDRLRAAGLVIDRDEMTCTGFPVLIDDEQAAYARLTTVVAMEALDTLSPELTVLLNQVQTRGWSEWKYHFVWSQLFDSQTAWSTMLERGLVPSLGRVIVWSIYPDHPFRSGTNYFPDDELRDHWLMVTWRPNASNTIAEVGAHWRELFGMALEGDRLSQVEIGALVELGLADSTGVVMLPVLVQGDPLLESLKALAARYVGYLERHMPLGSLMAVTGVDRRHTFAMAYHDVSWNIVGRLVRAGRVTVPGALDPSFAGGPPGMRGVAAIVPVEPSFASLIREALEGH